MLVRAPVAADVRVHWSRMTSVYRLALWSAIGFALLSAGLGAYYYGHARPMIAQPEKHQLIERILRDPSTPADVVRKTAIEGHDVQSKAFAAVDAALELVLIFGFGAAILFSYIAYAARKAAKGAASAP